MASTWTNPEISTLREMAAAGAPAWRIGRMVGRSAVAVARQGARIGIPVSNPLPGETR